ncbi:MAG TPA: hypothetical protein VK158_03415, partial [Acidobacteriota bacterium]|nr:hypothetical protein [Acidobacteriota bacterium]
KQCKVNQVTCELVTSLRSIDTLKDYDVVRFIDCDNFAYNIEKLPQAVSIDDITDAYAEKYLSQLSVYEPVISQLQHSIKSSLLKPIIDEIASVLPLLQLQKPAQLDKKTVYLQISQLNIQLMESIQSLSISGTALLTLVQKKQLPREVELAIDELIASSQIPSQAIIRDIPLQVDETVLDSIARSQSLATTSGFAKLLLVNQESIRQVPEYIILIERICLVLDFVAGMARYKTITGAKSIATSDFISMTDAQNMFLKHAQPISYSFDQHTPGSYLTGANSGGKTTLLEHILQIISLKNLGLGASGDVSLPDYESVYYFAKSKGSANKGAFETMLTQLATIQPSKKTLVLADEMEAVTDPAVAGIIMNATAKHFLDNGCHLIFATHLGKLLMNDKPKNMRFDGIEATGLDEEHNLVVNHNPVIGRLAQSTPELIITRLAKKNEDIYFQKLLQALVH